jgi:hypothetical protein
MEDLGLTGINPEYSAMGVPGGILKRYPLEENHMICPEMTHFRMGLSAVSDQPSAKSIILKIFC